VGTLTPHSNRPLYRSTVIGTLAVDGWAVTFGTVRSGLGGLRPRPNPLLTVPNVNSPPINGQCTNFILFNVALNAKGLKHTFCAATVTLWCHLVIESTADVD